MYSERQMNAIFAAALLALLLVLGRIAVNDTKHSAHKESFKAKCEAKGGVVFVPKGVRGWPTPECRNPNATIKIDA